MNANKQLTANKFEEQVYDYFNDELNIPLSHFVTKGAQAKRGENRQGVEIKNDQRYKETGNLYISTRRSYEYKNHPSGIYRDTETKQLFYVIGDEHKFWVLATRHLTKYHKTKNPKEVQGFKTQTGGTEYGFLLPTSIADAMAVEVFSNQTQLAL